MSFANIEAPLNGERKLTSVALDIAREKANLAFDEHCAQWDALQKIPSPTLQDLDKWLTARKDLYEAQAEFEVKVREIHGI
ncbi:hypothetical protein [Comamonas testosteroni]|uniref:hypothetical protein n=1 Tax=Comamonas testosteroni TaxID=285 RepID=UPI00391CE362